MAELKIGLSAEMMIEVTKESTAAAVGSGSLEVFATPMMIAAMEEAACNAIFDVLGKGETSVGTMVNVEHLAPTPVGGVVHVWARLVEVDGRSLTFEVGASDEAGFVGRGKHKRFIVNADRFMEKAQSRK